MPATATIDPVKSIKSIQVKPPKQNFIFHNFNSIQATVRHWIQFIFKIAIVDFS